MSKALRGSSVNSAQLPVIHGQETGDGSTEAAERDTVLGKLDHQWSNLGGWGEVLWKSLSGKGFGDTSSDILSSLSLWGEEVYWWLDGWSLVLTEPHDSMESG